MSSLAFLVTELQSLASETRRKHPEIREAAEKSLTILRSSPEQASLNLASDGPQATELLRPVFMGCSTKNAKVIAISLGSLQRLVALKAVPQSAVPQIITTMGEAIVQGVDTQLRILQTLLSLITNFPAVHGDLLGEAMLLCFKLHESRITVVSSTAAATLRQLVMFVFDKMVDEDTREPRDTSQVSLPNGSMADLGPSARDAFSIFEDLCLLANSERPRFLRLDFLHKTFALELIESVLTNYYALFRKRAELLLLLQHHLGPLLLKALSERLAFPLFLRCTRVVLILLKQFSNELPAEVEVFLVMLIKILSEEAETPGDQSPAPRPHWMRVLTMEVIRGLCNDAELIRNIWDRYDAQQPGSNILTSLIATLKRLVTEKPSLLGVCSQMSGVGVSPHTVDGSGYSLDVGGVAGMVATAASATVSGVVGMIGSGNGLSFQSASMKIQCIDQLDKADSPAIPEAYIYLLTVQCLISLCEGFASFTNPLYNSIVVQRPRAPGEAAAQSPPAFDLESLPEKEETTKHLRIIRDIVEHGWPPLLAALSFVLSTNLSDDLFVDVLSSIVAMTNVSGMMALTTPRDAFFASLSKYAIPARVVSSIDSFGDPQTPRTSSVISENLGLSGPPQPPGLSERNMACLKAFISSAKFLAGNLGGSWFSILETVQNGDYVLSAKVTMPVPSKRTSFIGGPGNSSVSRVVSTSSTTQNQSPRHPSLSDLNAESLQASIQKLFEASRNLEDSAFQDFIAALCRLSSEMVGMQSDGSKVEVEDGAEESNSLASLSPTLSPRIDKAHRRRVSGIHIPRTLRSGDFGINKLGLVASLNIHRLIYRDPEVAWNTMTSHLLSIIRLASAPQPIRIQAARVLDDILVVVPRNLSSSRELQPPVQRRVLDVLSQQIIPDPTGSSLGSSTGIELRRMGLETLHQILQTSGHTLVVGWETIFEMLGSVCKGPPPGRSASTDSLSLYSPSSPLTSRIMPTLSGLGEKNQATLVKIAFQSMTLVCDSVTALSAEHLRLCIATLGQFGRQPDTNIALNSAESLLWSVSDAIQSKRKDAEKEPEYSEIWMFLLSEVLGLCSDPRPQVRAGAIQTLFRTMQLYGGTLSLATWDECVWKIMFPLLEILTAEIRKHAGLGDVFPAGAGDVTPVLSEQAWDDSKILALQSTESIFHGFLTSKILHLNSFANAWNAFVNLIAESVLLDNRRISAPALRCLEKAVRALAGADKTRAEKVDHAWQRVWKACDEIAAAVLRRPTSEPREEPMTESTPYKPFTQESLVAFVDVIQSTRFISKATTGAEWPLERLTRLMAILKGVLTYPSSLDYRPDVDNLTPVQAAVMTSITEIGLSEAGVSSIVMQDLSEFSTLPFLAAFNAPSVSTTNLSSTRPKRITYVALAKKTMPLLADLYLQHKGAAQIYTDGTYEAVLSAYSIPIKLKYDCPPASNNGKAPPLWKTATTCFLKVTKDCAKQLKDHASGIPNDRVEGIWSQLVDVFRGAILADCSAAESFPLDVQEAEENFDLALISALEIDVVPYLGDSRVPDSLVAQLAKVLHKGSHLYSSEWDSSSPGSPDSLPSYDTHSSGIRSRSGEDSYEHIDKNSMRELGSTFTGQLVPRERFSYWCFDLLFLICSSVSKDQESSRKRLAALSLPSLLNRCQSALVAYVADEALRGGLPFPRVREEELIYVLQKILHLRLWHGSLWAALSDSPSTYASDLPPIDASQGAAALISDAVKRSPVGHLFHLYPILCEIAGNPRRTPSTWVTADRATFSRPRSPGSRKEGAEVAEGSGHAIELDARALARECLKEVGKEMGVGR